MIEYKYIDGMKSGFVHHWSLCGRFPGRHSADTIPVTLTHLKNTGM